MTIKYQIQKNDIRWRGTLIPCLYANGKKHGTGVPRQQKRMPVISCCCRTALFIFHFSFFISLSGCVKDDIYNTDHPEKAKVTITTDWNDRGEGVEKPDAYTVAAGEITAQATTDTYTLNHLFDPGSYDFILYNEVPLIPVTNGVAAVRTVSAPEGSTGTYIDPLPGWLFTGSLTSPLVKDQEYAFAVSLHQQVRELTLIIEPEGGLADQITAITGILSGIAGEFTIGNQVHGKQSDVALTFHPVTEGENTGKWYSTVRLLGIAGEVQTLSGTITFTSGSLPESVTLESNLSHDLAAFNTNKKTPLTLDGQVTVEPDEIAVGFTASISDWKKVNSGTGAAQ